MLCHNSLRIALTVSLGLMAASFNLTARSAELMFPSAAFVGGTSRINSTSSASAARLGTGWYYGKKLSRVYDRNYSHAESYCTLGYDGAIHVKNLALTTFANPSDKYVEAISDMRTSTRGNDAFEYITVLVKPTAGEAKGRKVRVTITFTAQYNLSSSDGYSGNYFTLYLNGNRVVNEPAIKRAGQGYLSRTFSVDTTIGQSINIAVQGVSYARKGRSAQQTIRLSLSAPVTAK